MANRFDAADLIIYLDYSWIICFKRFIERWMNHRNKVKVEQISDPAEKFSFRFFMIVVYKAIFKSQKREIESIISEVNSNKILRISSPKNYKKFINKQFGVSEPKTRLSFVGNR